MFQRIINLIPPHDVYIEPFLGAGAIMRLKSPAVRSIGIDLDTVRVPELDRRPDVALLRGQCGIDYLERFRPRGRVFVYCDPPYVHAARGRFRYRCEMTDADHVRLLRVLVKLPCHVMLSGYPSELYRSHGFAAVNARNGAEGLRRGWSCETFDVMTRGHTWRTECLWFNYPRPAALHDLRFVGSDFRERWRIEKRRRRWRARLAKLDPLERATLFSALVDVMDPSAGNGAAAGVPAPRARNGATRAIR